MAYKKTYKVYFGKNMKYTHFGKGGSSHGMYSGGYENWIYGIKGLFGLIIEKKWGSFL